MWRYELCQVFRQVEARERGKKLLQRRGRKIFFPYLCVSAGRR